ncbi:MAG: DUF1631 family protein [Sedimenticola sp.]|nr:DUF1631 family protein [Sedimenticola sp.]
MTRDRRKFRRYRIHHPARLRVGNQTLSGCHINNFSRGGFSLALDRQAVSGLRDLEPAGDDPSLQAEVLLDAQSGDETFQVPVRIAFASDGALGVAFMQSDSRLLAYLSDSLRSAGTGSTGSGSGPLAWVESLLDDFLKARFSPCLSLLEEACLELEDRASQQDQPELRRARNVLSSSKDELRERFLAYVGDSWQQLHVPARGEASELNDDQNLELVDQQEFDEWASVVALARRQESRLSHTLFELSRAFAFIVRTPVSSDNNPLAPYSLLWAFKKSLDPLELAGETRQTAYRVFSEQILAALDSLYQQVYQQLDEKGQLVGREERPVREVTREAKQPDELRQRPRPRSLIETLSSYIGRRAQGEAEAHQVSSNAAVTHALDSMVQGDQRGLADRVAQALAGPGAEGGAELSRESRQIIDATEQLLRVAQQDPRHDSTMRRILRQVQLPLAKAAIEDPSVLNDPQHASRQLLENLDQLALLGAADSNSLLAREQDQALRSVLESLEAAGGRADLGQVSEKVNELLSERRELFSSNIEQVVNGYRAARQASAACLQVRLFLEQELGGSISILVDRLLRSGWAGLMVQVAEAGEEKAKVLQGYQRILLMIHEAFQPGESQAYLKPDKWQKVAQVLHNGFKVYALYQEQSESLIDEIGEALRQGSEQHRLFVERRVEVDAAYLDQLLPASAGLAAEEAPQNDPDPLWLVELERLREGDWLMEQQQHGRARVINLALHDIDNERFLFVDGSGVKVFDCHRNTLLRHIQEGRLSFIEGGALPMVERAVEVALKQRFETLRDESDLDTVTGLHNRRALRREVSRLREACRQSGSRHTLVCMDVDNFSLVNDLCGMQGGDHFLARLANLCRSFSSRSGTLARTGSSEFSLLWEGCPIAEGYRFADSLRKAVEQFRFEWGGEQVSVTVSIGLVELHSESGLADELMNEVHSACAEAKRKGRNRCVCYQLDAEAFVQRKRLIESVPLIEKALSKNRLDLHAQLIQPVFIGEDLHQHHEILLRSLDEQDKPGSPEELILAAEQFERMSAVDRWVVERFFSWARDVLDPAVLEELGGFSLNLSGQSMSDDRFVPFLREQLQNSPIPPKYIAFEITETAMVSQFGNVRSLMEEFRQKGCQFFLDDFGSGYASYSYLKNFPVDVVKIDGVFVREIHRDDVSYAMVKSITEVAHHMGKQVIAEFVESEAILNALRKLEVDYAQGYAIGHPTPLKQLSLEPSPV